MNNQSYLHIALIYLAVINVAWLGRFGVIRLSIREGTAILIISWEGTSSNMVYQQSSLFNSP